MKKKIVIINGKGGSGKDTFVNYIKTMYPTVHTVTNISSIDEVCKFATFMGWEGSKTDKDRKFLSDLKKACIDWKDLPFQYIKEKIIEFDKHDTLKIMFIHIRERSEIEKVINYVKEYHKDIIVKKLLILSVIRNIGNISDDDIFSIPYDDVISNHFTLEDFYTKALKYNEKVLQDDKE